MYFSMWMECSNQWKWNSEIILVLLPEKSTHTHTHTQRMLIEWFLCALFSSDIISNNFISENAFGRNATFFSPSTVCAVCIHRVCLWLYCNIQFFNLLNNNVNYVYVLLCSIFQMFIAELPQLSKRWPAFGRIFVNEMVSIIQRNCSYSLPPNWHTIYVRHCLFETVFFCSSRQQFVSTKPFDAIFILFAPVSVFEIPFRFELKAYFIRLRFFSRALFPLSLTLFLLF